MTKEAKDSAELEQTQSDLDSLKLGLDPMKSDFDEMREETNSEVSALSAEIRESIKLTPTTYELLKDSETCSRLLNIISSNPNEFKNLPWDTAEKKLEYIFEKIRNSIVLFMKNKLWDSENTQKVINNTIAPAFEWSLMELLRDQWNETNVGMLQWIDEISRKGNMFLSGFNRLLNWVADFSKKAAWSYDKFSQWMNAVDYLSVHNWVLHNPNKSEVLSNPLEFQNYMNDGRFAIKWFSPYTAIPDNIFKIDENQTFEFGISMKDNNNSSSWEKSDEEIILEKIWNIQVVNNPKTTSLIAKMINKPEQFLEKTQWLQDTANAFLNWVNSLNSVTKFFWIDILWDSAKSPKERHPLYKILDFVCKLIWITWGLEWIVKRWRLDRMNFTDEKNENISQIFKEYKESAWENTKITITDEASCKTVLADFAINDIDYPSTKWDFLCKSMIENMNVSLVSPGVVGQILWKSHLKTQTIKERWKTKETYVVDESTITDTDKIKLAQGHLSIMKSYLENYKKNDLSEFYTNINYTEDITLCITASLYADKDDVIEWVEAKVFLPENYWSVRLDGTIESWNNGWGENMALSELTSEENAETQDLVEKSKTPNTIDYLENPTYKKYLNIVERDLDLPRYALECVCKQESGWKLYKWNELIGSSAWAQWLFQFMPGTADSYMQNGKLKEKYWKTFTSRDGFLKDPLAIAWAAWIILSDFMSKHNYNFQTSLACYNRWIGNYQTYVGDKNLTSWDLSKLPSETKKYVENITSDVLSHNSASSNDVLLADLWQYLWSNSWSVDNIEQNDGLLIWPKLLAHNKDEIWWLGNSIMNGFQWLDSKSNFLYMDWVVWMSTRTHPRRFTSKNDVISYKNSHKNIKSFMLYFWANNPDYEQTKSDITQRSEWLKEEGIQPVLCTCIWEDRHTWLTSLNQFIRDLWKEKDLPVFDFAKQYNKWDIFMGWDHPTLQWYSTMAWAITEQLQA